MIQITTYRDKGGQLGGLGNTVTRNLMHRWLCQGSCFSMDKQPESLPVTGSGRILYNIKHMVYIILYMGVSVYLTGKVNLKHYIYMRVDCSCHEELSMEHE